MSGASRIANGSRPAREIAPVAERDGAAEIVKAGIKLMSERGYHAASIRMIAKEAEMSTANLYHHFGSKHDLLVEIISRGIMRLRRDTDAALAAAGPDPVKQLDAVVRVHVVAHARRREISFVTTSEMRSLPPEERGLFAAIFDEQQACFDGIVERGIEAGVFSTQHPRDAARALASMCTSVAAWFCPDGELTPEQVADRYVEFAREMLGRPAPVL